MNNDSWKNFMDVSSAYGKKQSTRKPCVTITCELWT